MLFVFACLPIQFREAVQSTLRLQSSDRQFRPLFSVESSKLPPSIATPGPGLKRIVQIHTSEPSTALYDPASLLIITVIACQKLHASRFFPETLCMSDAISNVTDASFEDDVLKAKEPVLVDFWAAWCGPCKMIAPVLEELASEYAGRIKICKMDVDGNTETPAKFNIRSIPTLMIFKDGNMEAVKVGALSKTQLSEFIDRCLVGGRSAATGG